MIALTTCVGLPLLVYFMLEKTNKFQFNAYDCIIPVAITLIYILIDIMGFIENKSLGSYLTEILYIFLSLLIYGLCCLRNLRAMLYKGLISLILVVRLAYVVISRLQL